MRKKTLVVVAMVFAMAALMVQGAGANEMGNPVRLTPKGEFSLGLSASYLFEQKNKDYDLHRTYSDGGSDSGHKTGKFKQDQMYLLDFGYGLTNWLSVFAQAGVVTGGKMTDSEQGDNSNWESDMKTQFVWALGVKAQAFKLDNGLALDLSGRYLRYDDRKIEDYSEASYGDAGQYWSTDDKMDYWQVDLNAIVSYAWGPVTPYVGLGYSYSEADFGGRWTAKDDPDYVVTYDAKIKNDNDLAALCGLDVDLGQGLALYVQGVFVTRTELSLGLNWSF